MGIIGWMTLSIMLLQCACTWTIARVLYVLDLVAEEALHSPILVYAQCMMYVQVAKSFIPSIL